MSIALTIAAAALLSGWQEPVTPGSLPPTPKPPVTVPVTGPAPASLPSLDEALGLIKPSDKPPATGAAPISGDLDAALKGDKVGGEFEKAVALMKSSAARLGDSQDTSLEVQRMQEEAVRLLDALIKKGQNKKPNPQSQPKPQENEQQSESQPRQSQQSQGKPQAQPGAEPADSSERGGSTSAQMRPALDASRAAWGNLPQRVRQLLMQGSGDQFSKEYQRMTEEYYKRLGEQGN